jgi:hypothetical protein
MKLKLVLIMFFYCFSVYLKSNESDTTRNHIVVANNYLANDNTKALKYKIDSLNICIGSLNSEIETYESLLKENKRPFDFLGIGTVLVSIFALFISYRANKQIVELNKKELKEKVNSFEREEIYKRLNDFYGPLLMYRRTSKTLHDIFKNKREFRTLTELLDGVEYHGNERELILEILRIGKECKKIIIDKSGLIDDKVFRNNHLPKLLVHYTLIEKAFNKELKGEISRFEEYIFPKEIDDHLEKRVDEMLLRLETLNKLN